MQKLLGQGRTVVLSLMKNNLQPASSQNILIKHNKRPDYTVFEGLKKL